MQRVGAPFGVAVVAVLLQSYLDMGPAAAFRHAFWWAFGLSALPLLLAYLLPARLLKEGAPAAALADAGPAA